MIKVMAADLRKCCSEDDLPTAFFFIPLTRSTHCAERLAQQDMYVVCMLCIASRKAEYYNLNLL